MYKTALICASLFVGQAALAQDVTGEIKLLSSGVSTTDPSDGSPVAVDVYGFELVSSIFIDTLDFTNATAPDGDGGFSGTFLNVGSEEYKTDTDLPEITFFGNTFTVADTFFVGPTPSIGAIVNVTDEEFITEGLLAVGNQFVPLDTPTIVAVFSTPTGSAAPTFEGGFASSQAGDTAIVLIPEPASLALVGMGALAMATRRRRA